jgi:hypothetical protein
LKRVPLLAILDGIRGRTTRRPSTRKALSSMLNPGPSLCGKATPILVQRVVSCFPDRRPAKQIQKVRYSGLLNYVVTRSGALVTGRTIHPTLSGGADVLAAGEARFVNGALRSINNASGHYRPSGASAQAAAEAAFGRAGFDAAGKYTEGNF